jgi:transposase
MIQSYYDASTREGSIPMRGADQQTGYIFSYLSPEERVPADHPLRAIRRMTEAVFERLSPRFDRLYSDIGRPSIAPEKLLRVAAASAVYRAQ